MNRGEDLRRGGSRWSLTAALSFCDNHSTVAWWLVGEFFQLQMASARSNMIASVKNWSHLTLYTALVNIPKCIQVREKEIAVIHIIQHQKRSPPHLSRQGRNQVCSQRWARLENFPFSNFFSHFGTPQTNFSGFKKWQSKQKRSSAHFHTFPLPF